MAAKKKKRIDAIETNLSPFEIKRIRESLGLTQVQAGEVLGGGPRAFQKYENGDIQPSVSVVSLLRVLRANPSTLADIAGPRVTPIEGGSPGVFRTDGRHINALTERKFVEMVRRVLSAEAYAHNLPLGGVHVASNITAPDGGEDARAEWTGGPNRTPYIPSRNNLFQIKATKLTPAKAGSELLHGDGLKPAIRDVLVAGGTYIVMCNRSLTRRYIQAGLDRMLEAATSKLNGVKPDQIKFLDADQIAEWVNSHSAVAIWVLEQTQPGLIGPFRSWSHWSGRHENESSNWVEDNRLPKFRDEIRKRIAGPHGIARVLGPSGVGKSRLVLEALGADITEDAAKHHLSDIVMYAVEAEVGSHPVIDTAQALADSGSRAVIVVDRCSEETHNNLAAIIKRSGSKLSLVSIDHEFSSRNSSPDIVMVGRADDKVVEAILKNILPGEYAMDVRRLVKFSEGYPQIAVLLGKSWAADISIAAATDDALIKRVILGRSPADPAAIEDAAMLVSTFNVVGVRGGVENDLGLIAPMATHSAPQLKASLEDLRSRGVVQGRGRFYTLQPLPIALGLAEKQWQRWGQAVWDDVLFGELPVHLRVGAARQLALLNTRDIGPSVARYVCRLDGRIASIEALCEDGTARALSLLAEADGTATVGLLEHLLGILSKDQLKEITGDTRRNLVWLLTKVCFVRGTFVRGAKLMLDLAEAENEKWANNATGEFTGMFAALGGSTEADAFARLSVLDEAIASGDDSRLKIAIGALAAGIANQGGFRIVGSEEQGSKPSLKSWYPQTYADLKAYVAEFTKRLSKIACRTDNLGNHARQILGSEMRGLAQRRYTDLAADAVRTVIAARGKYWPQALESLGDAIIYDLAGHDPEGEAIVRQLIKELSPTTLQDRLKYLVTEMPWDFPSDEQLEFAERDKRKLEAVNEVAREALQNLDVLEAALPALSRADQRMSVAFGRSIAKHGEDSAAWYGKLLQALESVPEKERDFGMLLGFLDGVSSKHPVLVQSFKELAARTPDLASALPWLCSILGITKADIDLACWSLKQNILKPVHVGTWTAGGVLPKLPPDVVIPLFDLLLNCDDIGFWVGIDLIGMYAHGKRGVLEELRPQLKLAASRVPLGAKQRNTMHEHHFWELMKWILNKGRSDADARNVALSLTKKLIDAVNNGKYEDERLFANALPTLLSEFPDITWVLLGQAIAADRKTAWHFETLLGDKFSFEDKANASILRVSEDALFAWAQANLDVGPAFIAKVVPLLANRSAAGLAQGFHPTIKRLLDELGDREDVRHQLHANIHTFGWSGSRANYYKLYENPLALLDNHPVAAVRRWAKQTWGEMQRQISMATDEDEELDALN